MTTKATLEGLTVAGYEARTLYACGLVDRLKAIEAGRLTAEQRDQLRWAIDELAELGKWGDAFLAASQAIEFARK